MKIEKTEVYGMLSALRGMRNPMNSWDKIDTSCDGTIRIVASPVGLVKVEGKIEIGKNDLDLCHKLIRGGKEHRKFLRQIGISVDLTLPRYIWQEVDTYKVSTVRNSCSTMHKLGGAKITADDFQDGVVLDEVLMELNNLSKTYAETKDYDLVRRMKKLLPEGFLQKSTYTLNYETALVMIEQRKTHRLPEWSGPKGICAWLLSLPYIMEFYGSTIINRKRNA